MSNAPLEISGRVLSPSLHFVLTLGSHFPAPVQDIPVAPAKLVMENIIIVFVLMLSHGMPYLKVVNLIILVAQSDNTCSDKLESSKTLLGVVIYEKSASQNGWIMTVKPVATDIQWGVYGTTTGITDKSVSASCTNTQKLVTLGSSYEAAITANNYNPTGTPSGKKWCLPSYDLLNNINNSVNFVKINVGITTAEGTKLGYGGGSYSIEYIWSSSEYSNYNAWYFGATSGGSFSISNYIKHAGGSTSVRPVMEF